MTHSKDICEILGGIMGCNWYKILHLNLPRNSFWDEFGNLDPTRTKIVNNSVNISVENLNEI